LGDGEILLSVWKKKRKKGAGGSNYRKRIARGQTGRTESSREKKKIGSFLHGSWFRQREMRRGGAMEGTKARSNRDLESSRAKKDLRRRDDSHHIPLLKWPAKRHGGERGREGLKAGKSIKGHNMGVVIGKSLGHNSTKYSRQKAKPKRSLCEQPRTLI